MSAKHFVICFQHVHFPLHNSSCHIRNAPRFLCLHKWSCKGKGSSAWPHTAACIEGNAAQASSAARAQSHQYRTCWLPHLPSHFPEHLRANRNNYLFRSSTTINNHCSSSLFSPPSPSTGTVITRGKRGKQPQPIGFFTCHSPSTGL